jgi:hypothetical protein
MRSVWEYSVHYGTKKGICNVNNRDICQKIGRQRAVQRRNGGESAPLAVVYRPLFSGYLISYLPFSCYSAKKGALPDKTPVFDRLIHRPCRRVCSKQSTSPLYQR